VAEAAAADINYFRAIITTHSSLTKKTCLVVIRSAIFETRAEIKNSFDVLKHPAAATSARSSLYYTEELFSTNLCEI